MPLFKVKLLRTSELQTPRRHNSLYKNTASLIELYLMAYLKLEGDLHLFLTSALDAGEWLVSHPVAFFFYQADPQRYVHSSRAGRIQVGTIFLPLSGVEPWYLARSSFSLGTIPTELNRLLWYTLKIESAFGICGPSVVIIFSY